MRRAGICGLVVMIVLAGSARSASQAQPSPVASPANPTSPQIISLDLKGVDIADVLKLLSQQSGLNFVAGHNVSGRVTMFAKDVDVWQAFEMIMSANELAYEQQGDLINVMTARDYELLYGEKFQERKQNRVVALKYAKAIQLATTLNQLKSTLGQVVVDEASNTLILSDVPNRLKTMENLITKLDRPTATRILSLNYAEAEKLKENIQEFLTPGVGTLSFDARTNKVIVTDFEEVLPKIEQVILAFDEQEGEVLIEAKIIKVELTNEQSLGIDWQQVFAGVDTKVRGNFRVLSDIIGASGTPATGVALKFLSAPSGNTQTVIEALKKYGKVDTLSNPRITVSNHQEAKILVGTKEAFVTFTTTVPATGSTVSSPEIQFVDVGTKLFVTPRITRDGHIQLKIRPEVSTSKVEIFKDNRIPIVSTTEAQTNVLVKSGTTLVIGGLIDSKTEHAQSQVPLLGDVPLLGAAFRSRVDTKKKTELVIFLTPQIISPGGEQVTTFQTSSSVRPLTQSHEARERAPLPEGYQAMVRELLRSALTQAAQDGSLGEGSITLSFLVALDGRLIGAPEITSPQGEPFVQAAQAALQAIVPLPAFPDEAQTGPVRLRLTVEYHPPR
ncbi:MAG: type II secretion system protein GspD [Candidatus Omnitrophica bacterium]|nr:type II secretion system protein GspD [Candidatus Omnitrophota bacterium]